MTEHATGGHPDLDLLADYLDGGLGPAEVARVTSHLDGCLACRLEAKQMARFAALADDAEAAAAADWPRARDELERRYDESIRPSITAAAAAPSAGESAGGARAIPLPRPTPRRRGGWLRWALPAAAAAAAVLALVVVGDRSVREAAEPRDGLEATRGGGSEAGFLGPLRGGGADSLVSIAAIAPLGEIAAPPDTFRWHALQAHESYALEIYTADLATVFETPALTGQAFTVPDSLRDRLKTGETYLWGVRAHDGLAVSAVSREAWFRIIP